MCHRSGSPVWNAFGRGDMVTLWAKVLVNLGELLHLWILEKRCQLSAANLGTFCVLLSIINSEPFILYKHVNIWDKSVPSHWSAKPSSQKISVGPSCGESLKCGIFRHSCTWDKSLGRDATWWTDSLDKQTRERWEQMDAWIKEWLISVYGGAKFLYRGLERRGNQFCL